MIKGVLNYYVCCRVSIKDYKTVNNIDCTTLILCSFISLFLDKSYLSLSTIVCVAMFEISNESII